jgi:actin-like ATPase involved in cell morphogenesis
MVVPYGDNLEALAIALKEFPAKKVIALVPSNADAKVVEKVKKFLQKEGAELELHTVEEAVDGFFLALAKVKENEANPIVNVSVGTSLYSHVLLCAAMATGVTAFGIFDGELVFLPISCSISHGK